MDFQRLTEADQVEHLGRLAARALEAWDLAHATLRPIKYRENAVFEVTGGDGTRRVLRVHRPRYRSDDEIRSEAAWMQALSREGGVPTPEMIPTRSGELLTTTHAGDVPEPRQCDLLSWVDGQPLGTLEHGVDLDEAGLRRTYSTVGEIAGRIHAHADVWKRPAGFVRPSWDIASLVGDDPAFGRFWELAALDEAQRAHLLKVRDVVQRQLAKLGPPDALIHGDLIPDNLLASNEGVRVIDFDDCGWSWFGFELVTSLFSLLLGENFDVGQEAYLEGYRSVRATPDAELASVPTLVMARALSYLGWLAGRPEIASQQQLVPFLIQTCCNHADVYLAEHA